MPFVCLPHSAASLEIDNPVTNNAEIAAIIKLISKVKPTSYIDSATLPPTSGEKNEIPKLPATRARPFTIVVIVFV